MLAYNKVQLYAGGLTDYVWITDSVLTDDEINATLPYRYMPTLKEGTSFIANFTNDVSAGNAFLLPEEVQSWAIYRKAPDDPILRFVAEVPLAQPNVVDYNIANNEEYEYVLFAITENYISAPMESAPVKADWGAYAIIDMTPSPTVDGLYYVDGKNTWLFNTQIQTDSSIVAVDKAQFDNFTQFPKIASGKKNYLQGGISMFINNVYNERYYDTIEMQKQFRKFISNGNPKLFKDRKGDCMIVDTMGADFKYNDASNEQITTLKFTYTQIGSNEDINVIERG